MISRTIDWLARYLNLTGEEQIIPRKLESLNPVLSIDLDYFWQTVGPTQRLFLTFDHAGQAATQIVIPFNTDLDTLVLDWTWINLGGANFYFINWDLIDINQINQTTIYRERISGTAIPGIVTRTQNNTASVNLTPNQFTQPRLIRSTERLVWFVDDGGVGADANTLTVRFVEFPKNGPIPRLAF